MLCTQTDVEQRLQIDFNNDTEPLVVSLIAAAQGHIEREVGRPVEADDYTDLVDGPWGPYLWLAHPPVNSIATVTVDGEVLAVTDDYLFTVDGRVARVSEGYPLRHWSAFKLQTVEVVYNGGWVTPPADLVDVCANVAARAFQAGAAYAALPEAAAGGTIRSVALAGSDSVEFAEGASGGLATMSITRPVQLTTEEIDICRYYRIPSFA